MTTPVYLMEWGYASWSAWQEYSLSSGIQLSDLSPLGPPIVRPSGILLWRGRFITPTYRDGDNRLLLVNAFFDSLTASVERMIVPVPTDHGISLSTVTVQPIEVEPGARNQNGIMEGWTVEWLEAR